MTRFPLRRLRLRPGEEHRDAVSIELEPFELGGLRYLPVPHEVESELTIVQATTGLDLRLAFDVRLHGPCMRCLTDAVVDISIDAREYHANEPGEAVELRSEYVVDDQLELSAWARDAIALALPDQILHAPDCAGLCPVCGKDLNVEPHTHVEEDARPSLVGARGAPRPPVVRWRSASAPAHDGLDETQTFTPALTRPSSSPRPLEAPCASHSTASSVRSAPAPFSTTST